VRWTFEVSADVDEAAKNGAPVRKTARKRAPVKPGAKRTVKPIARRRTKPIVKDDAAPIASMSEPASSGASATVTAAPVAAAAGAIDPAMTVQATASPAPVARAPRYQWIVLAAAAVLVVAAVAFPRGPAAPAASPDEGSVATPEPTPAAVASRQPIPAAAPPAPVQSAPVAAAVVVAPAPASEVIKKPPVSKKSASAKVSAAIAVPAVEPPKKEEPAPVPAMVESPVPAASEATGIVAPGQVTITGCLEISTDGSDFRLTEASGADVPKSRSWRSGFFKKRAAAVNVVAPSDRAALKADVGKRVAATGQLTNRDLRVSSIHVVGSCN
jgi:hypothetical protein